MLEPSRIRAVPSADEPTDELAVLMTVLEVTVGTAAPVPGANVSMVVASVMLLAAAGKGEAAALDAEGEWFLARDGTLLYKPMPGEDMSKAEVIAPVAEKLVPL